MKNALAFLSCLSLFALGCSDPISPDSSKSEDEDGPTASATEVAASKTVASGKVKAPATNLEVEILDSNSDFINHIYLVSPGPDFFVATDDDSGTIVSLPAVALNEELIFEIRVHDPSDVDTGVRWRTGPPARNSDLHFHAIVDYRADGSILVSMEDIDAAGWGVGDEPNYVDAVFVVREDV